MQLSVRNFLPPDFPAGLRYLNLDLRDQGKEDIMCFSLVSVLCHQVPSLVQQWACILLCLPSASDVPVETTCPFTSLTRCYSRWALALLTPSLLAWTVSLCSPWVTHPCFHRYVAFSSLIFLRSSMCIYGRLCFP